MDALETVTRGGVQLARYDYNPNGTLMTKTGRGNSITRYGYDNQDFLRSIDSPGRATFAYDVHKTGHRKLAQESGLAGRTVEYKYDDLWRLTREIAATQTVDTVQYTLDDVGNRTSRTSTIGAVTPQTNSFDYNNRTVGETYDNNGNTLVSNGSTYSFDYEDRLKTANVNGNLATYTYDGDGNRVTKTVNGITTRYLVAMNC